MKQMNYFEKIQNRIESLLDGDLFVISDFLDVADFSDEVEAALAAEE